MIPLKSLEDIRLMAKGGKKLSQIVGELGKKVRPGITTKELDGAAEALLLNCGAESSFKGYQGYPAVLCTSVNDEIVHSVPSERILKEGDIISLDLGLKYQGFHADMAVTLPVGKISLEARKLIEAAKESLRVGIGKIEPGSTFGDIGNAIQKLAESRGFAVVRELCGHGIGKKLHEDPQILNYGDSHTGPKIKEGMVFCLEPMLASGGWRIKRARDGFGFVTRDGSLSAHFEQTIALTKKGVLVLTPFC